MIKNILSRTAAKIILSLISAILLFSMMGGTALAAGPCPGGDFFGLPTWHKFLPGAVTTSTDPNFGTTISCTPKISSINDFWLVGLAILDLLLRLSGIVAVVFVIWAGIQYVTSQGESENTKHALQTGINALIGAAIAIVASALVAFLATKIS